jgi:hypothetical protein
MQFEFVKIGRRRMRKNPMVNNSNAQMLLSNFKVPEQFIHLFLRIFAIAPSPLVPPKDE